jgi:hypothetical protein
MGSLREDRSKETSLWQWLKRAGDRMGKLCDLQRIEDSTKKGTPDVEGCLDGETFWCELKVAHEMAGGRWRVKLTTAQVLTARRRRRARGRSWVLVRVGSSPCRHYLFDGLDVEQLHEAAAPLTEVQLQSGSVLAGADASASTIIETLAGKT